MTALICCTHLAEHFDKWWIVLFALLFFCTTSAKALREIKDAEKNKKKYPPRSEFTPWVKEQHPKSGIMSTGDIINR